MASYTPNLDLLKKNPLTEGSDTFNITTMLNDNWDKIDAKIGNPAELWVWEKKNASTTAHIGYVVSTSSTTYPEDGQSGDYWYTRLGQIGGCAHIETGSYLSTGAYGAANAMSLTFDFIPKMVMVYVTGGSLSGFAFFNIGSLTEGYLQYAYETAGAIGSGNQQYLYAKINNKTLSWYSSNSAALQLNALFTGASLAYHYIAIG